MKYRGVASIIKRAENCKCADYADPENSKTRDCFHTVNYRPSGNGRKTNPAVTVSPLLSVACGVFLCCYCVQ